MLIQDYKNACERQIKSIELIILCLCISISGMVCNFKVIVSNYGKMPVKTDSFVLDTFTHFTFVDNSEVNFWYLGDIFEIFNSLVSIGDLLMFLGFILLIYPCFVLILTEIKNKKIYSDLYREQIELHLNNTRYKRLLKKNEKK